MKTRSLLCLTLSLALALTLLAGCGGGEAATAQPTQAPQTAQPEAPADSGAAPETQSAGTDFSTPVMLKVANILPDGRLQNQILLEIEAEITERSNGAITFENYLTGTLGTVREMAEALVIGSCDIAMITNSTVSSFIPSAAVIDLPFLFADYDHAYSAIHGNSSEIFANSENTLGTYICTFTMGYNQLTNNTAPIEKLEDLSGLKIRVNQSDLHIDTLNALGANATPIAGNEMYAALQQGVVDGNINPVDTFVSEQHWDIQKYCTVGVNSFLGTTSWFMSNACRDRLPEGYAELITEVFIEHTPDLYARLEAQELENVEVLKENMEVNELDPAERERFLDAVAPVLEKHGETIGLELIEKIQNAG